MLYIQMQIMGVTFSGGFHGDQLVIGLYQGGNLFALIESRIHNQYTRAGNRFSSSCQFPVFNSGQILNFSTHLTFRHRLLASKRKGFGICSKCRLKKTISSRVWHDLPINRIGLVQPTVKPSKDQCSVLQVTWPVGCRTRYCSNTRIPSLSIMSIHPRLCWGGALAHILTCSWRILHPQPT